MSPNQLELLRIHARSFYLTIRLLPTAMREPVGLAYLLARTSDTLADEPGLAQAHRLQALQQLQQALMTSHAPNDSAPPEFVGHELAQAVPGLLHSLRTLPQQDQNEVRQVMGPILEGQMLDVQRFDGDLHALDNSEQLTHYTWLVAGCVGEFWTRLCLNHWPDFARAPAGPMLEYGRAYGMGLQGLNILRDTSEDLLNGRCYWPASELAEVGMSPQRFAQAVRQCDAAQLQTLAPIYQRHLSRIRQQLQQGLRYSLALRPRRLRLATALPALIGAHTLELFERSGPMALTQTLKLPRRQVRRMLWSLLLRGASRDSLLALWPWANETIPE